MSASCVGEIASHAMRKPVANLPVYQFEQTQRFEQPRDVIFAYFERAELLAELTPHWLNFVLLTPPPIRMYQGRIIDYTIRQFGWRLRWRSIISHYQAPDYFVDEQLKGPYSFWFHEHRFVENDDRSTTMIDTVYYALPNWLPNFLSRWLDRIWVRPQLKKIFAYREKRIIEIIAPQHEKI